MFHVCFPSFLLNPNHSQSRGVLQNTPAVFISLTSAKPKSPYCITDENGKVDLTLIDLHLSLELEIGRGFYFRIDTDTDIHKRYRGIT